MVRRFKRYLTMVSVVTAMSLVLSGVSAGAASADTDISWNNGDYKGFWKDHVQEEHVNNNGSIWIGAGVGFEVKLSSCYFGLKNCVWFKNETHKAFSWMGWNQGQKITSNFLAGGVEISYLSWGLSGISVSTGGFGASLKVKNNKSGCEIKPTLYARGGFQQWNSYGSTSCKITSWRVSPTWMAGFALPSTVIYRVKGTTETAFSQDWVHWVSTNVTKTKFTSQL